MSQTAGQRAPFAQQLCSLCSCCRIRDVKSSEMCLINFYSPKASAMHRLSSADERGSQLLTIVNNIVESESSATMLNRSVDNCEQCRQHNIVQACSK